MRKYSGKPKKQSASSLGRHWGNQESYKKDEKRRKKNLKTKPQMNDKELGKQAALVGSQLQKH